MTDRPDRQDEGGYYFGGDPDPRPAEPENTEATTAPVPPDPVEPERPEGFKRATRARLKSITPERPRGRWGLSVCTTLYVMLSAGTADYLPVGVRLAGHVLFWLAIGAALLVTMQRERLNDWEAAPRWPWAVALIGGTLAVEVLVAATTSPVVLIGSAIVLSVGLLILLMLG